MYYKTIFLWSKGKRHLYIFYRYNQVGLVPTDIDFEYRGKRYNTITVMETLALMKTYKGRKYSALDWYNLDLVFSIKSNLYVYARTSKKMCILNYKCLHIQTM